MNKRIPLAEPVLSGRERTYVLECLETGWVSSQGKYVGAFEEAFAAFCVTRHAIAVANGTVALHVTLLALGLRPGEEVLVPDLTYVASANAVTYCGARPIFVDVDPVTWTMDPEDARRKISSATRGILPVHLYGHPAHLDPLSALAEQHHLFLLEDAAEAHGARYRGRRVGGFGDAAIFSFYGNKIITTGEGGMVTTNDDALAGRIRTLKGQGMDPQRRYWFPVIGYNYRMTNLQAALGLAQLERIEWFIERRREVAEWYRTRLKGTDLLLPSEAEWATNVYWLYSVVLPEDVDRNRVMLQLEASGIETRPFFYPMHSLPPYSDSPACPVTENLARRGINLPSSASLSAADVDRVCDTLAICLEEERVQAREAARK